VVVCALIVILIAGSLAIGSLPRSVAAADFSVGDTAVVDTDALNLRAEPGIDAEVVSVLTQGTTATVTDGPESADDYGWYALELDDGTTGWAASDFLALLGSIDPGFVATMEAGTGVTVLDGPVTADDLPWYQLDAGDLGQGWSVAGFLGTGDGTTVPTFAIGDTLMVDADGLNLRDAAGLDGGLVDVLPFGSRVTVVDGPVAADDYDWYQLETDLGAGWSAGAFLVDAGSTVAVGDLVRVFDGDLNLRADAGLDAEVLDVLPDGAELEVIDGPVEADGYTWFAVSSTDFGEGWSAGEFLEVVTAGSVTTADTVAAEAEPEATAVAEAES
jgi:hypothetical protein